MLRYVTTCNAIIIIEGGRVRGGKRERKLSHYNVLTSSGTVN